MEQNNQSAQPAPSQTGKVMDVQPPGGQMPGISDVKLAPQSAPAINDKLAPPAAQPQPQPLAAKPHQTPAPPAVEPSQAEQPNQGPDPRKTSDKKPKGPILAVVLAIIVLLGLCGLAVFLYLQSNQDSISENKTTNTTRPATEDSPANTITPEQATDQAAEAVDQTLKDVENSSGADEKEISDDTLGL